MNLLLDVANQIREAQSVALCTTRVGVKSVYSSEFTSKYVMNIKIGPISTSTCRESLAYVPPASLSISKRNDR